MCIQKLFPKILLLHLIGIGFFLSACEQECPEGFSGEDCEVRVSDAFLGSYEGFVNCGFTDQYTALDIFRDQGPFDVTVDFTTTPDFILKAFVHGDSITFPDQWLGVPQSGDTAYYVIFETTGLLKGDTLDFNISLLYPGTSDPEKINCNYHVIK